MKRRWGGGTIAGDACWNGMERDTLAEDLRNLEPLQEKVVRLHYGLGCKRARGPGEIVRARLKPCSPARAARYVFTYLQRS